MYFVLELLGTDTHLYQASSSFPNNAEKFFFHNILISMW